MTDSYCGSKADIAKSFLLCQTSKQIKLVNTVTNI